jgi:hypothetical protein
MVFVFYSKNVDFWEHSSPFLGIFQILCFMCSGFRKHYIVRKIRSQKIIYFMNDEVEIFHSRKSKYLVSPISETMAF